MMEIVGKCRDENVEFKIIGSNLDFIVGKTAVTMLDDLPLIELHYNLSDPKMQFIKSLFDYTLAGLTLFLIYPFIYFSNKLTKKQSDFIEFILAVPKIFTGKYSFVGPGKNDSEKKDFFGKTGLTGYWYLEKNNQDELEKLDFYYAKNQNIWLDLEIIAKSFNKMWSKH
jgi:lipopolysaccharide/colanic/teichoic acid biosynthesis glycosyltransferase